VQELLPLGQQNSPLHVVGSLRLNPGTCLHLPPAFADAFAFAQPKSPDAVSGSKGNNALSIANAKGKNAFDEAKARASATTMLGFAFAPT
jgi:hypothetical protein